MNQITSFNEYQTLASRTAAMGIPEGIRQATFALGLVGEAGEVAELYLDDTGRAMVTLPKELGDTMWYAAALCTAFDLKLGEVAGADDIVAWQKTCYPKPFQDTHFVIEGCKIADYLKKVIGHDHDLDKLRLTSALKSFLIRMGDIATEHRLDVAEIANTNIEKLWRRYPKGWDTLRSKHRESGDV